MKKFILSLTCAILPLFGWGQNNNNIQFADEIVKSLSVASWDTNGDGELSYSEAAAVTSLGDVFRGSTITSFDELQYFTGLTDISPQAFSECMNLEDITLPFTITAIGQGAFVMCDNLRNISIPASVTAIGDGAFWECMSLEEIFCYVANPFNIQEQVFFQPTYENATLHVPQGTKGLYQNTEFWSNFANIVDDLGTQQQGTPEPYAVLSQNNTVLTFYYDDQKEQRNGMGVGPFTSSYDDDNQRSNVSSGWDAQRESITSVIFDASIADCTTLTSTAFWFYKFNNLSSITGIGNLKTDNVTNMSYMFADCSSLTSLNVKGFKTGKVTKMSAMFDDCSGLTSLDVSGFKTENVTDMGWMFYSCSSLTSLDVSGFNTDKVTDMQGMFKGCSGLTSLDVSGFNTDKVTVMLGMFNGCSGLTSLDVSGFNTANVTNMWGMFADCSGLTSLGLTGFKTDKVTDMRYMFWGCSGLTTIYAGDGWSTAKIENDMGQDMFTGCTSLVGGAGTTYNPDHVDYTYAHIDGGAANPGYFTAGAEPWTEPEIEVVLTGKIDNFWYDETGNNPNGEEAVIFTIPETPDEGNSWDVNVLSTFVNNQLTFTTPDGEALNNITGQILFETRGNMVALDDGRVLMYEGENEQEEIAFAEPGMGMIRIYNSNITQRLLHEPNAKYMALPVSVRAYLNNEEVTVQNGSFTVLLQIPQQAQGPEPYAVLSQNNTVLTFYYDEKKAERNGMGVGPFTISYDNDRNNVSSGWDAQRESITSVIFDSSFADCTTQTSTAYWFMDFNNLNTIIGISNLKTDNVTDMTAMFSGCSSLMSLDLSGFKTDNVTNMGSMFEWCRGLTSLDVTGFKTNNVTDMRQMFAGCSGLTSLDVTGFKTDNVTNMYAMFVSCSGLTSLDVTGFNTENVTDMGDMFSGCSGLTSLDVRGFKTDNVTSMRWMFADCRGLTSLDLTGFKTDNVTNMANMFGDCQSLTSLDVTGFKTDNVTSMYAMFAGCSSLTSLGLTGFKTDNVTDMGLMFYGCSGLRTIYVGDGWSNAKVENGEDMFSGCTSLVGGAGTRWDANHTDYTYAHIDGGTANPGYFTEKTTIISSCPDSNHPHMIDLGLPSGTKWACCNVGADKPEAFGGFFAWGEIEEKASYTWENYIHCDGTRETCHDIGNDISGTDYDVAHVRWGDKWQMPTLNQIEELYQNCSFKWATQNGVDGGLFIGQNGSSIFLPATIMSTSGPSGWYWSSAVSNNDYSLAQEFYFWESGQHHQYGGEDLRCYNRSVRPVYVIDNEKNELYAVLSQNNTVLTFYYDDQIEERGGISVDDESWERREQELTSSIVALVFDESFSDFVVNDSEGFSINLDGWTSLAAVKAGSINIPAEEYAKTGNPNLLVYVNEPSLAPQDVQNVVINGVAQEIILTDATEGNNNWFCPESFTAEKITYTRNFSQQTEIGISRGWESIALPFTVQDITHESKGRIIPFGAQGTGKYFWLRGYSPDGLHRATVLEANTPYVISMPNNPAVYPYEYNLNGRVTFSAENTTVPATPETWEMTIARDNIRMAPVFQLIPRNEMAYAINVGQPLDRYAEGSVFTRELREVRPFEAVTYHEPVNGARPQNIRIAPQSDDDITGIRTIELDETEGTWYFIDGRQLQGQPQRKGVYLQKGKKIVVK